MRSPLKYPDRLKCLLDALADELVGASDDDVLEACADLGMQPHMKGSAAFIGLKGPSVTRLAEFFDLEALQQMLLQRRISVGAGTPSDLDRPGRRKSLGDGDMDEEADDT